MGATILRNAKLHLAKGVLEGADSLAVQNHRIIPLDPVLLEDGASEEIDLNGMHIAPGFIDLLVNGCAGVTFASDLSLDGLERMRRWQALHGTLTFVPTLVSGPRENMTRALSTVRKFMDKHPGVCPGLHLEGPFINPERKGFHGSGYIRGISNSDITYLRENLDNIAYMTIAPEVVRGKFLVELLGMGLKLSLGHTNASFNDTVDAFKMGVTNVTHLFNAMRPLNGREPGIIGAVLNAQTVTAGVIADGRHVHPAIVRIIHAMLKDRMYIVSDSQAVAGSPEMMSSFTIAGTEVFNDSKRGLIDAKGSLVGTNICMMDGVKFLVKTCGIPLEDALRAASAVPARVMGIDHESGYIDSGYRADLIVFNDDFKIRYIIQNGFLKTTAELI